jgi:hypothetical protein
MDEARINPNESQLASLFFSTSLADKILFVLYAFGNLQNGSIMDFCMKLPGVIRKSTRTFYKAYTYLIKHSLIEKTLKPNSQYYIYEITQNGRNYIENFVQKPDEIQDQTRTAEKLADLSTNIHPNQGGIQTDPALLLPILEAINSQLSDGIDIKIRQTIQQQINQSIQPILEKLDTINLTQTRFDTQNDEPFPKNTEIPFEDSLFDDETPGDTLDYASEKIIGQENEEKAAEFEIERPSPIIDPIIARKAELELMTNANLIEIIINGPSTQDLEMIWEILTSRQIPLAEKFHYFQVILEKYGISVEMANLLLKNLEISIQELFEILPQIHDHELLYCTIFDVIMENLVLNPQIDWKEKIAVIENSVWTKKGIVLEYIAQAIRNNDFSRALKAIYALGAERQITIPTANAQLELMLNGKQYPELEQLIAKYDILQNQNLHEFKTFFEFIAFRAFYEQNKIQDIIAYPGMPEKWVLIAKLEQGLRSNSIGIPIKEILMKFCEPFRRDPDQDIMEYFKANLAKTFDLLLIAPHLAKWFKMMGFKAQGIQIMQLWWENSDKTNRFLGMSYECFEILQEWDDERRKFWSDRATAVRKTQEQIKYRMQTALDELEEFKSKWITP